MKRKGGPPNLRPKPPPRPKGIEKPDRAVVIAEASDYLSRLTGTFDKPQWGDVVVIISNLISVAVEAEKPTPPPSNWVSTGCPYAFRVRAGDWETDRRTAEDLAEIPMRFSRRVAMVWRIFKADCANSIRTGKP